MPNYPTSLDALANPTSTTLRNDPGFSLAAAVSTLNDIAEAVEAKLGIGASTPGATGAVLRRTGSGASAWGTVAAGDIAADAVATGNIAAGAVGVRRLSYAHAVDVYTGSALGAAGTADLFAAQTFAVDGPGSVVGVSVIASLQAQSATVHASAQLRVHVDATVIALGGGLLAVANGLFVAHGGATFWLTGLAAGSHTVKASVLAGGATLSAVYFRPATVPSLEYASATVVELKR